MPSFLYYAQRLRMHAWMLFMNSLIKLWLRRGPPRSGLLPPTADIRPTLSIRVPSSKDTKRSIAVNIFYPPGTILAAAKKLPVHLHIHGSGFCYKTFTADSELAAFIAQKAGCVVLDTDYAKAPGHPFPAGFDDVSDVVSYILSKPDDWDLSRFTIGGASSGGCLALAVAAQQPKGTLKGALTLYPATDLMDQPPGTPLVPAAPKGNPGLPLRAWERRMFRAAYVPEGVDKTDPRVSPIFARAEAFPPVTIITGDCDPLLPGIQRMVVKLRAAGNDVEEMLIEGAAHGWERMVKPSQTKWVKIRDDSLQFFIERLQKCWTTTE
ncbi:alpha/beta-hydrolase, partial [Auricularia subglabra TFB-10046 SS5]